MMRRCVQCGGLGAFKMSTYLGAPDGGVPVHERCLAAFFDHLDRDSWWKPAAKAVRGGDAFPVNPRHARARDVHNLGCRHHASPRG
jgi:hypothetical protein